MSLVWIHSCRGPWLGVGPVKDSGSDLLPQSSQAQVQLDLQRTWLRITPSEVPDSRSDLQRFLVPAYSLGGPRLMPKASGVLAQVYFLEGPRFTSGFAEVSGSG